MTNELTGGLKKFREEQVDGLTMKIDGKRADGLTHKIREELTVGLILLDGMVQVVTWARTKRAESLVDLDGTDDTDSLDYDDDGGFDDGYDGGADGFEPTQRRDNCKRR